MGAPFTRVFDLELQFVITSSFVHLPGVGPDTEEKLWSVGCLTWDDLAEHAPRVLGRTRSARVLASLTESRGAYEERALEYFHARLKGGEKWRLAADVLHHGRDHHIAYLDIESTGLGFPPETQSTTIAIYWGGELFVEHQAHLKRALIERLDAEADLLVSFNGTTFDLPFLRREFGVMLAKPHVDLRYWFGRHGHAGGLKAIQTRFPMVHQRGSMDIDGFDAVRLWRLHQGGVPNALETLMTYNAEDTIVLEQLLHLGMSLEASVRPHLGLTVRPLPRPPVISTQVCEHVYRMLR